MPAVVRLVLGEIKAPETRATSLALVGHLVLASMLFGVACVGLVTSSHLGGETGGVFRSFAVPGALAAIICTAVSTRALVSVHDGASRQRRRSWAVAGVPRAIAGLVVAVHLLGLTAVGASLGLAATDAVSSILGSVTISTTHGAVEVDLDLDVVGALSAVALVLVSVVPAVVPFVRRPYGAGRRSRTLGAARLLASTAAASLAATAVVVTGDVRDRDGVERVVALSLLLLLALVLLLCTSLVRSIGRLLRLAVEKLPIETPVILLTAAGGASAVLRTTPGASASVAAVAGLLGGMPAVFLVGDEALRVDGTSAGSHVDVVALLSTLGPALLLGASASAITFVVARPSRSQDAGLLRASGAGPGHLVATSTTEALLFGLPAGVASTAVVTLSVLPLAIVSRVPFWELVACIANPLFFVALGTTALALVLAAVLSWSVDQLTTYRVTR